ncbi:hypothetical protein FJT64_008034 [Amphibalanus amphitrite]|uniref:Apple domain-containing protein n=3 Tax=Amphibalanus amphitrite TaxID=1232801 RepID=A0A6A4VD38_AMPAM|nr:hypothetical protein FJT64_008034 [Amphibalanus amphitrite]
MFPSVPSTPLFLGALFICASAHLITGCQNIDLYAGVLDPSLELQRYSPHQLTGGLSTRISPCTCCALCHHRPTCQSVSYDPASSECILYSTVGTLRQLTRNQSNQHPLHFFLPRHSQTDQFCLRNSDCIMPGDLCRAHICTPELTVTCRHLFNMARRLSSARHWTHINGTDVITECYRNRSDGGYTLLLNSVSGYQWTREDRLRRIKTDDEGRPMVRQQYSILW